MAVRNYDGFGQGLAQGFGLVQSAFDRRDKKELAQQRLEADARRDADTAKFRSDKLAGDQAFREAEAERAADAATLTAEFRSRSLGYDEDAKRRDEQREADELAWKQSPRNPVNVRAGFEAAAAEDTLNQAKAYDERVAAAGRADEAYKIATSGMPLDADAIARIGEIADQNAGTMFDFDQLVDYVGQSAGQDIQSFNEQLANPRPNQGKPGFAAIEMSYDMVRAYDRTLNLGKTTAVGRRIDDRFKNAPDYMKGGNYVVVRQGLHSVQAVPQQGGAPTATGKLYVVVRNQENGEEDIYFPPITANRLPHQTQATDFTFEEISQAAAGGAYMANTVGRQMREQVRAARIQKKYGDRKNNTDGTAAFNEAVDRQAEAVRKAIQGGEGLSGVQIFLSDQEASDMKSRNVSEQDMALIRDRVGDNILFGTTRTPEVQVVSEYVNRTATSLSGIKLAPLLEQGFEVVPKGNTTLEGDNLTLGDVLEAHNLGLSNQNPKDVLEYNHASKSPKRLVQYLLSKNLIRISN